MVALLSGCAVGPNYKRPPIETPGGFRGAPEITSTNSLAELPWWEVFKDETLQALIRQALTNNYNVRIGLTRVEQAHAIADQTRGLFFPQLDYLARIGRGRNSSGGVPVPLDGITTDSVLAAGTASWELDFWGRIRRLNESARAQYLATSEAQRDVIISLISGIAQTYFQLLALDRELEIAKRTTNTFGESLRIFSERLQGGIVSKLETSAAEAALASAAATVPELERQITFQENLISILLGVNPGAVARTHSLLDEQLPPEVPPGLPSSLLERRPDIREAEQFLRAANARVGAAVANFFPQISLTALAGRVSPELSAFTGGAANAWSVAAGLTGPIFHGGTLAAQRRQALAAREDFRLQYQASVLNALQEVSNALVAREKYAEVRAQQARAVKAYEVAVEVSRERYVAGRAGYYEVLQEQQLLFPAENLLVQTQLNQLLTLVQLYRALGGGWNLTNESASPK